MLELQGVNSFYEDDHILFDIDMSVNEGEVVALIGRNGVGKTTTLRSIMNLATVKDGSIKYRDTELVGMETDDIARLGIGYVPETREIFHGLTVEENLNMAATNVENKRKRIDDALTRFPKLRELKDSKGGQLSGGEQQMVAIARVLIPDHSLLLIDEPTEGLAPQIAQDVSSTISELKDNSTILLVAQSMELVFDMADRIYGMDDGEMIYEGTPNEIRGSDIAEDIIGI